MGVIALPAVADRNLHVLHDISLPSMQPAQSVRQRMGIDSGYGAIQM